MGCQRLTYHKTFSPLKVVYNDLNINSNTSLDAYRYGFNNMEKDDEIKGSGNSYDFGARIYDPRVVRWLSRDSYERKHPDLTPYNFAANNPVLFVDPDGNDNVIYLVVQNNDDCGLDNSSAHKVAAEANKMFMALGVESRVVVFNESSRGEFDMDRMDDNDSYAIVGSSKEIFERTNLAGEKGALEYSDNYGNAIGVYMDNLGNYKEMPTNSVEQLIAFGIVHGRGHNSSKESIYHPSLQEDVETNYINFMTDGAVVMIHFGDDLGSGVSPADNSGYTRDDQIRIQNENKDIKNLYDLFEPGRNKKVISSFIAAFGTSTASDNYDLSEEERANKNIDSNIDSDYLKRLIKGENYYKPSDFKGSTSE